MIDYEKYRKLKIKTTIIIWEQTYTIKYNPLIEEEHAFSEKRGDCTTAGLSSNDLISGLIHDLLYPFTGVQQQAEYHYPYHSKMKYIAKKTKEIFDLAYDLKEKGVYYND